MIYFSGYSNACERNKNAIFEALSSHLKKNASVLEVGSGTGQHAQYFCEQRDDISWQSSDVADKIDLLEKTINAFGLTHCKPPITLDVNDYLWDKVYDMVFTANTLHIMTWEEVARFLHQVSNALDNNGVLALYGPFKYNGKQISESNCRFDQMLKKQNPKQGIRDLERIKKILHAHDITITNDYEMPANNRLLIAKKRCITKKTNSS